MMLTSRHVEGGCKLDGNLRPLILHDVLLRCDDRLFLCGCGAMTGGPRVPVAGGENSVNVPNSYALDDYANSSWANFCWANFNRANFGWSKLSWTNFSWPNSVPAKSFTQPQRFFGFQFAPPVSRDSKIIIMSKRLASFSKLGEKLGDEQESTRLPDSGSEAGGGAVTWKPNAARREVHPRPITRRAPDDRPNKFEGSWNPKVR